MSAAKKPHSNSNTKGDPCRAQNRIHNIDQAGDKISLEHFPYSIGRTERADQKHDDSYHDPVRMCPDP